MGNNKSKSQFCSHLSSSDFCFTMDKCGHTMCHQCLHDYIKEGLKVKLKCPTKTCYEEIPDKIIRQCLSNKQTDDYDQMSIMSTGAKSRKCLTNDCPSIVLVEDNNTIYNCNYCEQPNCWKCMKRHTPSQCKKKERIDEEAIEADATQCIERRKQEEMERLCKNRGYIPNPDSFVCEMCDEFILPRLGIMLRNCYHCYCRFCYDGFLQGVKNVNQFKCPSCDTDINHEDIFNKVDKAKFANMLSKNAAVQLFHCKYPDCPGFWDIQNGKGVFPCPTCKHVHCLECGDLHEDMSCKAFKETKRFKNNQIHEQILQNYDGINCICGKYLIIQPGRCGAIKCDNCFRQVCKFTKKEAVKNGPNSCGCTSEKPCHKDCKYGCIPE